MNRRYHQWYTRRSQARVAWITANIRSKCFYNKYVQKWRQRKERRDMSMNNNGTLNLEIGDGIGKKASNIRDLTQQDG